MKVTVLYGGPSSERPISLISGKAVADALQSVGHSVYLADITPGDLTPLDREADVVFPVLHGAWGESGELQELLEARALRFVGSGSRASRLGMDKVAAKEQWRKAGLSTPAWRSLTRIEDAPAAIAAVGLPCVLKVIDGGSSIDVFLCSDREAALRAAEELLKKYGRAMVEKMVVGRELTVGILDRQPLDPIWIRSAQGFYDFLAKYEKNDTQYLFDLGLAAEAVKQIQELALAAHQVLGCRHLSRVDIMLEESTLTPYILEINTLPGFTSHSLLPKAAARAGLNFGALVDKLVGMAAADSPAPASPAAASHR